MVGVKTWMLFLLGLVAYCLYVGGKSWSALIIGSKRRCVRLRRRVRWRTKVACDLTGKANGTRTLDGRPLLNSHAFELRKIGWEVVVLASCPWSVGFFADMALFWLQGLAAFETFKPSSTVSQIN